jgi:hypothetical protein
MGTEWGADRADSPITSKIKPRQSIVMEREGVNEGHGSGYTGIWYIGVSGTPERPRRPATIYGNRYS